MEILSTLDDTSFLVDDDVLNFTLGGDDQTLPLGAEPTPAAAFCRGSFPEFGQEEELEWLSNKDAFPAVETCFGILSDNPELILSHNSPISVLENSTSTASTISTSNGSSIASCCNSLKVPINYPVRPRSKRRRRRRSHFPTPHLKQELSFLSPPSRVISNGGGSSLGRRCQHCQAEKTPRWRAGPMGPKTLCNACGVRYKSGRLLPEYRPANSPTFSNVLHSNSHRKVVEMRNKRQEGGVGVNVGGG